MRVRQMPCDQEIRHGEAPMTRIQHKVTELENNEQGLPEPSVGARVCDRYEGDQITVRRQRHEPSFAIVLFIIEDPPFLRPMFLHSCAECIPDGRDDNSCGVTIPKALNEKLS